MQGIYTQADLTIENLFAEITAQQKTGVKLILEKLGCGEKDMEPVAFLQQQIPMIFFQKDVDENTAKAVWKNLIFPFSKDSHRNVPAWLAKVRKLLLERTKDMVIFEGDTTTFVGTLKTALTRIFGKTKYTQDCQNTFSWAVYDWQRGKTFPEDNQRNVEILTDIAEKAGMDPELLLKHINVQYAKTGLRGSGRQGYRYADYGLPTHGICPPWKKSDELAEIPGPLSQELAEYYKYKTIRASSLANMQLQRGDRQVWKRKESEYGNLKGACSNASKGISGFLGYLISARVEETGQDPVKVLESISLKDFINTDLIEDYKTFHMTREGRMISVSDFDQILEGLISEFVTSNSREPTEREKEVLRASIDPVIHEAEGEAAVTKLLPIVNFISTLVTSRSGKRVKDGYIRQQIDKFGVTIEEVDHTQEYLEALTEEITDMEAKKKLINERASLKRLGAILDLEDPRDFAVEMLNTLIEKRNSIHENSRRRPNLEYDIALFAIHLIMPFRAETTKSIRMTDFKMNRRTGEKYLLLNAIQLKNEAYLSNNIKTHGLKIPMKGRYAEIIFEYIEKWRSKLSALQHTENGQKTPFLFPVKLWKPTTKLLKEPDSGNIRRIMSRITRQNVPKKYSDIVPSDWGGEAIHWFRHLTATSIFRKTHNWTLVADALLDTERTVKKFYAGISPEDSFAQLNELLSA